MCGTLRWTRYVVGLKLLLLCVVLTSELGGHMWAQDVVSHCAHRLPHTSLHCSQPTYMLIGPRPQGHSTACLNSSMTVACCAVLCCRQVGFKPTGRMCTKGKCQGYLVDHILDWEDALPPAELKATEQHASAAVSDRRLGGCTLQLVHLLPDHSFRSIHLNPCCSLPLGPAAGARHRHPQVSPNIQSHQTVALSHNPNPQNSPYTVSPICCTAGCTSGCVHLLGHQPADHSCCKPAPAHSQGRRQPGHHQPAGNPKR